MTRAADVLVAAIGRPGFVTEDMVKPGAVLIDVGINRVTSDEAKVTEFFGDDAARACDVRQSAAVWWLGMCIRRRFSGPALRTRRSRVAWVR